jgi:hypothetical protein
MLRYVQVIWFVRVLTLFFVYFSYITFLIALDMDMETPITRSIITLWYLLFSFNTVATHGSVS